MSDDAKKAILARRAKFIAAAVASVGIACGKTPMSSPEPCLSIAVDHDAAPMPCLSMPLRPPDAGATAPADAGSDAEAGPKPIPMPCLSVRMPPRDAGKP